MIAPRRTTLVRVPDLRTLQHAIAERAGTAGRCVVLMPTEASGALVQTKLKLGPTSATSAVALTRAGWYEQMQAALEGAPRRLSDPEREVMLSAAMRDAVASGVRPPFRIRPGLVPAILAFYDELRRLNRTVETFERVMAEDLAPAADVDRGAARLLVQTTFLAAVFRGYESRLADSGLLDEHGLRQVLLNAPSNRLRQASGGQELGPYEFATSPTRHVIVAVGDRLCDPAGLWPADFDLLTRVAGVERIDVLATEQMLRAGFQQRIEDLLPGLEHVQVPPHDGLAPVLVAPELTERPTSVNDSGRLHHVSRDREEELLAAARQINARARDGVPPNRIAIVVRRPLPYVYLARSLFAGAGLPFHTTDALPLAAEPFAAALNLVFDCVLSRFTRGALVDLIRSPHFAFGDDEGTLDREAAASLSRTLADAGYLGDLSHLARLAEEARAATIALGIAIQLEPLLTRARASVQLDRVLMFVQHHAPADFRLKAEATKTGEATNPDDRLVRGRAAILEAVASLRDAYLRHHDPIVKFDDLVATIKRRIEEKTFALPSDIEGAHLVDAQTAAFGDFDQVHLVGLVEGEWPERHRPSIFYPGHLLYQLGWPPERERVHATRAAFRDLLDLARNRVVVSTFTLDGDDIVESSSLLEQLEPFRHAPDRLVREVESFEAVSVEEALATGAPPTLDDSQAAAWLTLRQSRSSDTDSRFHGEAGRQAPKAYAVTAIDLYLDCPFKYFATHVLKLQQDPEDEETMSQKTRGRFIHDVFRAFFERWQALGEGGITVDTLDRARTMFQEVVEGRLASLSSADARLERRRLLGSSVAAGLGERVFRMEAERPVPIVERLLEFKLDGEFDVSDGRRTRRLRLRGTADRLDLLADGSLRLIDYKLGRGPQAGRAIQLPVYALMASQRLVSHRGRSWVAGEAGYLAFGRQEFASIGDTREDLAHHMTQGQKRLLDTVESIEHGSFPPQPAEPFFCGLCAYASVCRKDYVELEGPA